MKRRPQRDPERGSALIMTLITTAALAVVMMSLAGMVMADTTSTGKDVRISQARYAAEAGVSYAKGRLKEDGDYAGGTLTLPGGWSAVTDVTKTGPDSWRIVSRAEVEGWQVQIDADVHKTLPPAFDYTVYGDQKVEMTSFGLRSISITGERAVFSNRFIDIEQLIGQPDLNGQICSPSGADIHVQGVAGNDPRLIRVDPVPMPEFKWEEAKAIARQTGQFIDPPNVLGRKLLDVLSYISFRNGPIVYVDGDVASLIPYVQGSGVLVVNGDVHVVCDSLDQLFYGGNLMILAKGEIHFVVSTGLLDALGQLLDHPPVYRGVFFSEKAIEATVYPLRVEGSLIAPTVRTTWGGTEITYNRQLLENVPVADLFTGGRLQVVGWTEQATPVVDGATSPGERSG